MNYLHLSILTTVAALLLSASIQTVDAFVLRAPSSASSSSSSLPSRQLLHVSTAMAMETTTTTAISHMRVLRTTHASKAATIRKTALNSNLNSNNNNNEQYDEASDDNNSLTQVGSTDYYQGFINRPIEEEPTERVTGDAVLGPTLKFAGGVSLILVVLVGVFLVSNGIV